MVNQKLFKVFWNETLNPALNFYRYILTNFMGTWGCQYQIHTLLYLNLTIPKRYKICTCNAEIVFKGICCPWECTGDFIWLLSRDLLRYIFKLHWFPLSAIVFVSSFYHEIRGMKVNQRESGKKGRLKKCL